MNNNTIVKIWLAPEQLSCQSNYSTTLQTLPTLALYSSMRIARLLIRLPEAGGQHEIPGLGSYPSKGQLYSTCPSFFLAPVSIVRFPPPFRGNAAQLPGDGVWLCWSFLAPLADVASSSLLSSAPLFARFFVLL
jgi:hypothetical protein